MPSLLGLGATQALQNVGQVMPNVGTYQSTAGNNAYAGIATGSGLIGSIIGNVTANKNLKRQIEANRQAEEREWLRNLEMFEKQRQLSLDFWNMQNEYNTPSAQMSRFKKAGLNPNLIYGKGTPGLAGTPTSPSSPKYNARVADHSKRRSIFQGLEQSIGNYANMQLTNSQVQATRAQTAVAKQEALNKVIDGQVKIGQVRNYGLRNKLLREITPYQVDAMKYGAGAKQKQIEQIEVAIQGAKADNFLKENRAMLAKWGIRDTDNPLLRMMAIIANEEGKSLKQFYNENKGGFDKLIDSMKGLLPYLTTGAFNLGIL